MKKGFFLLIFFLVILKISVFGQPGCVNVTITTNGGQDFSLPCTQPCTTIDAIATQTSGETSTYSVSAIPYAPPYPYDTGTPILVNIDDRWSSVITLPFTFCFYGQAYNQLIAGSNGVVSFNLAAATGNCPWQYFDTCPSPNLITNAIFGPYHDIDPAVGGFMCYAILGTFPCRTFIVSWYQVPMFSPECNYMIATHQIVLYETSNIIEVYIENKPLCATWNLGYALVGIQDATGTQGLTPPGRNTSQWTAQNEAWRFTPTGSNIVDIVWYDGLNQVGTGTSIWVCPSGMTTYTAQANYSTCYGQTVTVDDEITVSLSGGYTSLSPANPTICTGGSINLTATGSNSFQWAPSTGLNTTTGANVTASPLTTTTYTVTGVNPGCTTTNTITVTVNPVPAITSMNTTICSGGTFTVTPVNGTNGLVPSGTTYSWSAPSVSGITGATAGTNAANISGTLSNTTNASIIVTYIVTPITGSCTGATFPVIVTVNPAPAVFNMSTTICSGGTFSVTPADGTNGLIPSGTLYSWTAPTAAGISGTTSGNNLASIAGTLTNSTNAPVNVNYTITPKAGNCTGATFILTVTVNPTPTATVPSNLTACNGGTVTSTSFSSIPAGGTFTWTNSNTSIGLGSGGTGNVASFTAVNNGTSAITATINVVATVSGCVGTPSSYTITVNPSPTVTVPANITICNNGGVAMTNFANNPPGGTFTWTNTNTSIGLPALGSGNVPAFTATNNGSSPATATITVTPIVNNCTGIPSSYTITVSPNPTVSVPANITVCNQGSVAASNFSSSPAGATFTWTNSNTAIGLTSSGTGNLPAFTASNPGSTPITATISVYPTINGCVGSPTTYTITVNPTPTVTVPSNIFVCNNGTVPTSSFVSIPSGGTFSWTNSNTAIGLASGGTGSIQPFTATNTSSSNISGSISVVPTVNTCVGTPSTYTITVYSIPTVSVPADITVCPAAVVPALNFTSTPPGGTFAWTNSNPSIGLPGSGTGNIAPFTATNSGSAAISAVITVTPTVSGCPGTPSAFNITVNAAPTVIVPGNISVCNGELIPSTNFTSSLPNSTFTWTNSNTVIGLASSGTGDISSFTAVNPGSGVLVATINVTPYANSCQGISSSYVIAVNPPPVLTFSPLPSLCITSPVLSLAHVSPSGGTYSGPGVTGYSFDPAAAGAGTHIITYDYTDPNTGCPNSSSAQIVISTGLTITVTPNNPYVCEGSSLLLTADGAFNFDWQPSIGLSSTTGANVIATPSISTVYTITGSNPDGCEGSTSVAVGIYNVPVLSIIPIPEDGCSPLLVTFGYTPLESVDTNTLYWNFGDLASPYNTSTEIVPSHLYNIAGNYPVYLSARTIDGCPVSAIDTVYVYLRPTADFYFTPPFAYADNGRIDFIDLSYNATSWLWNFNDPSSYNDNYSTIENPTHIYTDTGTFEVQLIAYNSFNCSDTVKKPLIIYPQVVVYIPNAFTPDRDGLNEEFKPSITGVDEKKYQFYIFDRWGKEQFYTEDLNEGWNGVSNGKMVEEGLYVYYILYRNLTGKVFKLRGIVTLVR